MQAFSPIFRHNLLDVVGRTRYSVKEIQLLFRQKEVSIMCKTCGCKPVKKAKKTKKSKK